MNKKHIYFWGCQIPARFPSVEKATRMVLEKLGVRGEDVAGFTCCPEKALAQSLGDEVWLLTAARNLALAEQAGGQILVTPCNGCYATLSSAAHRLKSFPLLLKKINEDLSDAGLAYKGSIKVKHLVELLLDDPGPEELVRIAGASLKGMRLAVHYGCHLLRPGEARGFEDHQKPGRLEAMLSALGAECIDYKTKLLCCGESLGRGYDPQAALHSAKTKLLDLMELQVDAMVVACPACFLQYDMQQLLLKRQGENLHLPVIHISELIGLALGFSEKEMGLHLHKIKADSFLGAWRERQEQLKCFSGVVDLEAMQRCLGCRACETDCPAAQLVSGFIPHDIIAQALEGRIDELLSSALIWNCLECHTCKMLCPNKFGMEEVFTALKYLAVKNKTVPGNFQGMIDAFQSTGRLASPQASLRRRLSLPQPLKDGTDEWKALMDKVTSRKQTKEEK